MCMDDICSQDTTVHVGTYSPMNNPISPEDEQERCEILPDCVSDERTVLESPESPTQEEDEMNDLIWMLNKPGVSVAQDDWGMPGFLTKEEFRVFKTFRSKVLRMNEDFRSTIFSFEAAHEEEEYALCRWLRANKFYLDDTLRQVHEAVQLSSEARRHQFYPNPATDALGVHPSIYVDHFPQFNHGRAKNGSPIFISKPGVLNFPALACITTPEGIVRYHWWLQTHDLAQQFKLSYQSSIEKDGTHRLRKYETLNIMDLDNLTASIFSSSKYPLQLIRAKSNIDQVCFPETLDRMIIINAPAFFTFTWRIIRGFIDARNASKVEIYGKSDTDKEKWQKRLRELIDEEHIPTQYREVESTVSRSSTPTMLETYMNVDRLIHPQQHEFERRASYHINTRTNASTPSLVVSSGEMMQVSLYTRSIPGGFVQIYHSPTTSSSSKSSQLLYQTLIEHKGDGTMDEPPTCIHLTSDHFNGQTLNIPGSYTITVIPSGGTNNGIMPDDFVIAIYIHPIPNPVIDIKSDQSNDKDLHLLVSPSLTNRIRSKDKVKLFRTPDDLSDAHDDSFEVPYAPGIYKKKGSRWTSSRYLCDI